MISPSSRSGCSGSDTQPLPMDPVVRWLITSGRLVSLWSAGSWSRGTIRSATVMVSCLPSDPAGWLSAKSAGEIPWRSIHTAARASPIAIATAVLAVGARLSGQTSRSTLASSTTSLPRASDDSARPTRAILAVPRRFKWGSSSSSSVVSPLLDSSKHTSSAATTPRSPCKASRGLR